MRRSRWFVPVWERLCFFTLTAALALPAGARGADPLLSEVLYDPPGVNSGRQSIEIRNPGAEPIAMGGYWLRLFPVAWRFPGGTVIEPGGVLVVHVNAIGESTEREIYTGLSGLRSLSASDSIALYRSNLFQDPAAIVDFVAWGAPGLGGADVALAAGLWPEGAFVDASDLRPGSSLARISDDRGPAAWCVDGSPTIGALNDTCTTSYARTLIRLNEVGSASGPGGRHPFVELINTGEALEDLSGYGLLLGDSTAFRLPPGTLLGPGEILTVHFAAGGEASGGGIFTGEAAPDAFTLAGAASLHLGDPSADATRILDFVEWGAAGAPLEGPAVEAGVWKAGTFVSTAGLHPAGGIARIGGARAATAWKVDNTPTPGEVNSAPPGPHAVVINEILVLAEEKSGEGFVELWNRSQSEPFDLSGAVLCASPLLPGGAAACTALPPETVLAPGAFLVVRWNSLDAREGEVAGGLTRPLRLVADDMALFLTSDIADTDNLTGYVAWGRADSALAERAAAANLWPSGEAIRSSLLRPGWSIAYLGEGEGPDAYRLDRTPSPGASNEEPPRRLPFRRGDCNDDGTVDISDAIRLFGSLFLGQTPPLCEDACDGNDDSSVDISDAVFILNYLFRGGATPPRPGPADCAPDLGEERLTCNSYLSC